MNALLRLGLYGFEHLFGHDDLVRFGSAREADLGIQAEKAVDKPHQLAVNVVEGAQSPVFERNVDLAAIDAHGAGVEHPAERRIRGDKLVYCKGDRFLVKQCVIKADLGADPAQAKPASYRVEQSRVGVAVDDLGVAQPD